MAWAIDSTVNRQFKPEALFNIITGMNRELFNGCQFCQGGVRKCLLRRTQCADPGLSVTGMMNGPSVGMCGVSRFFPCAVSRVKKQLG
jgi:hypothetical protein